MNEIMVSVVVPSYNAEKTLEKCVRSLTAQTANDKIEIILVDDGSADGTGKLCDVLASSFERVKAVHRENGGVSAARNSGIAAASGKYLAFVDSDDEVMPEMYERMLTGDGADMVLCGYVNEIDGGKMQVDYPFETEKMLGEDYLADVVIPFSASKSSIYSCCNKLFLRKIVIENEVRFPQGVRLGEDMAFFLAFIAKAKSLYYIKDYLYIYNDNPVSATRQISGDVIENHSNQYSVMRSFLNGMQGIEKEKCLCLNAVRTVRNYMTEMYIACRDLKLADAFRAQKAIASHPVFREVLDESRGSAELQRRTNNRVEKMLLRYADRKQSLRAVLLVKTVELILKLRGKT